MACNWSWVVTRDLHIQLGCADCVRLREGSEGLSLESVSDCSQQELSQMQQQANSQWDKPGHPGWSFADPDPDIQTSPLLPEVSTTSICVLLQSAVHNNVLDRHCSMIKDVIEHSTYPWHTGQHGQLHCRRGVSVCTSVRHMPPTGICPCCHAIGHPELSNICTANTYSKPSTTYSLQQRFTANCIAHTYVTCV